MAFKVCSSCGKQVREIDSHCWNCKSLDFQTVGIRPSTSATAKWGNVNLAIICPQCQTKGHVHTSPTKRKVGISGAKATGAVLTLGWSVLATGLSRKQQVTQAHCDNCN